MSFPLPNFVSKYFWGDNLEELKWPNRKKYITKTILEKGDQKASSWLLKIAGKSSLKKQLNSLKLNDKSANFWKIYLA